MEFLKNVRVYKNNGKEIRVEGDVWGTPSFVENSPNMWMSIEFGFEIK